MRPETARRLNRGREAAQVLASLVISEANARQGDSTLLVAVKLA